jgi:hypothetical protein
MSALPVVSGGELRRSVTEDAIGVVRPPAGRGRSGANTGSRRKQVVASLNRERFSVLFCLGPC